MFHNGNDFVILAINNCDKSSELLKFIFCGFEFTTAFCIIDFSIDRISVTEWVMFAILWGEMCSRTTLLVKKIDDILTSLSFKSRGKSWKPKNQIHWIYRINLYVQFIHLLISTLNPINYNWWRKRESLKSDRNP